MPVLLGESHVDGLLTIADSIDADRLILDRLGERVRGHPLAAGGGSLMARIPDRQRGERAGDRRRRHRVDAS